MLPPCSSTRLLTIERPIPAPRWSEPRLWLSKRWKTAGDLILRYADPFVFDGEYDVAVFAPVRQPDGAVEFREADGIRHEIVKDLTHPRFIGHEFRHIIGDRDVDREARANGALANAEDRRIDDGTRTDRGTASTEACPRRSS